MNINKKLLKNLFITVSILIAIFVLYVFFFKKEQLNTGLISQGKLQEQTVLVEELLALSRELKAITLDTSLFDDEVFQSLEDYSILITPQPTGRRNPFLPL